MIGSNDRINQNDAVVFLVILLSLALLGIWEVASTNTGSTNRNTKITRLHPALHGAESL